MAFNSLYEKIRCARHSILHLKRFSLTYRRGLWLVRGDGASMVFDHYPYLAFHDIEGYMRNGRWHLNPGETVIDAGGCDGEFAIFASRCVRPKGRVIMLEPDPSNAKNAARTMALNGNPSNVKNIQADLWNSPGTLKFGAGQGQTSSVLSDGGAGAIEVPMVTLESLMTCEGLERIDFVKMDIEGAEIEAIGGVGALARRTKPRFAIASYHVREGARTAERLETVFRGAGFKVETGNERHLTTWAERA